MKYEAFAYETKASAILVSKDFVPTATIEASLILVDDVYSAVAILLERFNQTQQATYEISSLAFIHPSAIIGSQVTIGPFVVIEEGVTIGANSNIRAQAFIGKNVQIGEAVVINSGVKLYHETQVGDRSIIHANAVIGSDGFGFARQGDGTYKKIAQIGKVVIESDVEIGANTVIDRATMGSTMIRKGAKLDNLIQIAHNVEIGSNTAIAAQTGIAGSAKIGADCLIGGQVGIAGHLVIADRTEIQAKSGISSNVKKEGSRLYGYPAIDYVHYLKAFAVFKQLPAMVKKIDELEKKSNSQ
ncbi:MAG: UDP-3-O-(3-hydroxymyristoyl)glucosamine N-acyltransferase, partial [Saprospiraceae bacterium]